MEAFIKHMPVKESKAMRNPWKKLREASVPPLQAGCDATCHDASHRDNVGASRLSISPQDSPL